MEIMGELRENYSHLVDIFKDVKYKGDSSSYEVLLADQKDREEFYAKLNKVETALKYAVSSSSVYNAMENEVNQIEEDVKFYKELRRNVRIRYGDTVDMSALDSKMQQIVGTDVSSSLVSRIWKQINIIDNNVLLIEVEQLVEHDSRDD